MGGFVCVCVCVCNVGFLHCITHPSMGTWSSSLCCWSRRLLSTLETRKVRREYIRSHIQKICVLCFTPIHINIHRSICDGYGLCVCLCVCRHAATALCSLAGEGGAHEDAAEIWFVCQRPIRWRTDSSPPVSTARPLRRGECHQLFKEHSQLKDYWLGTIHITGPSI